MKTKRFFVVVANNGYRSYFIYGGKDFPTLDLPNPADYRIYEITEEEYRRCLIINTK